MNIRVCLLMLCAGALLAACSLGEKIVEQDGEVTPPPNQEPLLGCSTDCHGDNVSSAPPVDLSGGTDTSLRTVGAHRSHLDAAPTWFRRVDCQDCHTVPQAVGDPGHIDGDDVAELSFQAIARTDGATPDWNSTTCSGVYCHGATLEGGALNEPTWTQLDGSQSECGNCHGAPPSTPPHTQDMNCGADGCHPTMQSGMPPTFLDPSRHIDGVLDFAVDGQGCIGCHGSAANAAPPGGLSGETDPGVRAVGAHQAHLRAADWRRAITCSSCHQVPANVDDPGHRDGDGVAEVMFGTLNPGANYNVGNASCTNLYCHSNGRNTLAAASWTSQAAMACNSCHDDGTGAAGAMSGAHKYHIADQNIPCYECHATVIDEQQTFIDPNLHINGVHEIVFAQGGSFRQNNNQCQNLACHNPDKWEAPDDD